MILVLIGFAGTVFALESESSYFSNPDFQKYRIQEKQYEFFISYSIIDTKIKNITLDCPSRSMIIYLEPATKNGILTISIPRTLLDTKISDNQDDKFFVLVNGEEVDFSEIQTNPDARTLIIPFKINTEQIEILANVVIGGGGPASGKSNCGVGSTDESPYYHLLSPLKQSKLGIQSEEIKCKEGLILVTKYDGSPTCVKTSHFARFLTSGWYPVIHVSQAIRPLVTVLKDKDETTLGFELIKLASTSKGRSFGPPDSLGQPTVIYEHSLTSTLYQGNSSDGTIIVTKVTDIGSKNVTLTHVLVSGSIVTSKNSILTILYADAIGCSVEHFENENETGTCPYPTSIHNPVTLSPGESLIAYFSGDFKIGTVPITQFSPAIYYNIETTGRSDYVMELDVPLFAKEK